MSAQGGITKGKSHAEGGIPLTVKSTGQQVELEGGEGVINKRSMSDKTLHEFEGEKLTKCEIASKINSDKNYGVKIDCKDVVGKYEDGGYLQLSKYQQGGSITNFIEAQNVGEYQNELENFLNSRGSYTVSEIYDGDYEKEIEEPLEELSDDIDRELAVFQKGMMKQIKKENKFQEIKKEIVELQEVLPFIDDAEDKARIEREIKSLRNKDVTKMAKGGSMPYYISLNKQVEDLVRNLSSDEYEVFAYDNNINYEDPDEMEDFIYNLNVTEAKEIIAQLKGYPYSKGKYEKGGDVDDKEYRINKLKSKIDFYENEDIAEEYRKELKEDYGIDYARGGTLNLTTKQYNKAFHLPIEMAIYVPSTIDVNKTVSNAEMNKRVKEVSSYLSNLFGGYTSQETIGGYVDSKGQLVNEEVVKVVSFGTNMKFLENKNKILQKISDWCTKWNQEAIGFEVEGDLYYIPQNFATGGNVKGGKTAKNKAIIEFTETKYYPVYIKDKYSGKNEYKRGQIFEADHVLTFKKDDTTIFNIDGYNVPLKRKEFVLHSKKSFADGGMTDRFSGSLLNDITPTDREIIEIVTNPKNEYTIEEKIFLQKFRGNNLSNYISNDLATKFWSMFFDNQKSQNASINSIFLINAGIGKMLSNYQLQNESSKRMIYIDMDCGTELENIEREITKICNRENTHWRISTEQDAIVNSNSSILVEPYVNPDHNMILDSKFWENTSQVYCMSIAEFSNAEMSNLYFDRSLLKDNDPNFIYKQYIINQGITEINNITVINFYIRKI